ncbi:MAG: membrane protein insertion efficiency factor YidD [Candidatus Rokuibacteriota bacterium]|nr:MAG: membrane protein insertion efficiency factor YidD [Candidatus Rokubacteria bacterium]
MNAAARAAALCITAYQWTFSQLLPRACRFAPSCSEYARQAIIGHGLLRGGGMALRRLLRCHPFHPGGIDPPPPAPSRGRA